MLKKWWLVFSLILALGTSLIGCATTNKSKNWVREEQIEEPILVRLELAERYLLDAKPRDALSQLLEIEPLAKNYARYHFDLGMVYMALDEKKRAQESFLKAVKIYPNYGEAWNNLGLLYLNLQEFTKAKEAFQRALDILTYKTPEFPALNLARLFWTKGDKEQAKKYAKLSIDKNWRYIPAYLFLAKILSEQGEIEAANKILERGVEANPDNPTIVLEYAKSLLRLGQEEIAKKWFLDIIKNHADSQESQVARDYLDFLP